MSQQQLHHHFKLMLAIIECYSECNHTATHLTPTKSIHTNINTYIHRQFAIDSICGIQHVCSITCNIALNYIQLVYG